MGTGKLILRSSPEEQPPSLAEIRDRLSEIGRFLIEISEIFPGEALPVAQLMECLRGDGCDWDYFYLQQVTDQSR